MSQTLFISYLTPSQIDKIYFCNIQFVDGVIKCRQCIMHGIANCFSVLFILWRIYENYSEKNKCYEIFMSKVAGNNI